MDSHIENRKDLAWAAFRAFDFDGSGTISRQELSKVLEDSDLQQLLEQVAQDYVLRKSTSHLSPTSPTSDRPSLQTSPSSPTLERCSSQTTPSLRKLAEQRFD